jgi:transposase InsO family protein
VLFQPLKCAGHHHDGVSVGKRPQPLSLPKIISKRSNDAVRCPYRKPNPGDDGLRIGLTIVAMRDLCSLVWCAVVDLFQSRVALQAEILVWIARQLTEACGWNEAPQYLIRDRDGAYGETFIRRLEAMGIRDRPSSARSPWQNGHAERLIGSIRRDCLDVFGERHLRHLLKSYQRYYNEVRTHLSLQKDAPIPRNVQSAGRVILVPLLGGLHHQYVRVLSFRQGQVHQRRLGRTVLPNG